MLVRFDNFYAWKMYNTVAKDEMGMEIFCFCHITDDNGHGDFNSDDDDDDVIVDSFVEIIDTSVADDYDIEAERAKL